MREFGVEAQDAEDQKNKEDVRLDDARKKFLARREFKGHANWVCQRELHLRAIETGDFAAVKLAEQVVFGISDDIDELAVERLFFGESLGIRNGGLRELRVAAALLGEAAQKSLRVVHDFASKSFVDCDRITADSNNRRGCAGVRARPHGGDIGGKQNEKAGGSSASSRRRNVDRNGNLRSQDVLDDIFHRVTEPAGSIHADENEGGVAVCGIRDAFVDVGGENWLNFAVDF